MSIKDFVSGKASSGSVDASLLILRICAGLPLFLHHGIEKLTGYPNMVQTFPDPIHIGAHASLAFALLTDGICSLLIVFGLATRPAAGLIMINLLTALVLVHHPASLFFNAKTTDHLELVWLYITVSATLLFIGPGRFSLDAYINRKSSAQPLTAGQS